jgi:hypothetical protein
MRYVLMFVDNARYAEDWEARSEDEKQDLYARVEKWLDEHADRIVRKTRLQGGETATTVRLGGGEPLVTDGPFVEGKEVVSGYVEVEVGGLDEAVAMAKTWPSCPTVEIRPVM